MTFGLLWEITLGSWLTAALILLVRLVFGHWLNAKAKYALWFLLMLRLLPIPLRSPTSLLRFTPELLRTETVEVHVIPAAERFTELGGRGGGGGGRGTARGGQGGRGGNPGHRREGTLGDPLSPLGLWGGGGAADLRGAVYLRSRAAAQSAPLR